MISATQSNHPLGLVTNREPEDVTLTVACTRIRNSGMRVTKPRVALLAALLRFPGPASIERIHQEVGTKSCDLVTIYRCLAAFEGLGLVRRSYLHNGTCLYEQTVNAARRYHIICKECGRTDPVDYELAEGLEQKIAERGYTQVSHVVEFFGVCPICQQAAKAAASRVTAVKIVPSV
ncbi:Zinc uptake regulation protein [Lacunisphaera limnophila]|uniref:Zinc uptake regulation protein n=1 Tax=Lacunisphaera limnophila TaxID=1838286 RepID=A0A1D8AZK2_9BACT|nr:Fur family transcriptional regulator [Lacunisphaera limnophila]AOS46323.1 Zinc uptake regulation protein [Lacunisphaera limnophila]